jgi:hypothetical protein
MKTRFNLLLTTVFGALVSAPVLAGVSVEQAEQLKTTLTPFGAERAGNQGGTIPAWTGGYTTPFPGDKPGKHRGDPFAAEKPLFSITAQNMDQHAAQLTDGVQAMLKKYPDTYRLDVYPTHRTAAAPQWVYDNTFKNATRGRLEGDKAENVYGGIPFPIPKTGIEVLWNHVLRWRGESYKVDTDQYQVTANGKKVMISDAVGIFNYPYYFKDSSLEEFAKTQDYYKSRVSTAGPPLRAGEVIVGIGNLDGAKDQSWVYLAGQRRVRKLPNACCDTPSPFSGGLMTFDESDVWWGRLDRFDWSLVGKQEKYIPYNGNKYWKAGKADEILDQHHLKSEYVRWELHRVWVVEANLRQGQRHSAVKSRYYCDEDTWNCVLADRWDANGQLWKTLWAIPMIIPELPGLVSLPFGFNDLLSGASYMNGVVNQKQFHYDIMPRYRDTEFSPDSMAGEGIR